ncbi:hypothetical protein HYT51_01780 [Candidatus Woesearchaeota archaeon]|nr:hypothetical protein [Candidatus Woesearchaeota archaeon]
MNEAYIKIGHPLALRRDVLKSALETTRLLKESETYKKLRRAKVDRIKALKLLMNEIKIDLDILQEKYLPPLHENKIEEKTKKIQSKKTPEVKSDLERLNLELKDIEKKLREL